jgi:hypothetical protein
MKIAAPFALLTALLLTAPALASALAQDRAAAPAVGAKVVDSKGKPVGTVEKVITEADGRPVQVMVRVDRILRTLPVDALAPSGNAYASVLSRAEITALPPSE